MAASMPDAAKAMILVRSTLMPAAHAAGSPAPTAIAVAAEARVAQRQNGSDADDRRNQHHDRNAGDGWH